jgi:hypothetical protein
MITKATRNTKTTKIRPVCYFPRNFVAIVFLVFVVPGATDCPEAGNARRRAEH